MRRRLRNEIMVALAFKVVALALIWFLFFSPAHRMHVDGEVATERFGLSAPASLGAGGGVSRPPEKNHD